MKFFEKRKGSISVFLILILMPMYTCVYLAVDTARYSAAETKVNGAMDLSGNAALAGYNRDLKRLYGIFAMSEDEEILTENLSAYFSNMIDTAEMPLISDSLVRNILDKVINGITTVGGPRAVGNFENAVYTQTADFSATYVAESALVDTEVLEKEIRSFMKYRAPLNIASETAKKLSVFSEVDDIFEVVELGTEYYTALLPSESALFDVFATFSRTDELSLQELKSSLTDVLWQLEDIKQGVLESDEASKAVREAIADLKDGEIKDLMRTEYGVLSETLTCKNIDDFSKSIERDLEKLNSVGENTDISEITDMLEFKNNPIYKTLISMYSCSENTVTKQEAESINSEMQEIADSDLGKLYDVCKEECDYEVSGLIQHSVWEALYGKEGAGTEGDLVADVDGLLSELDTNVENLFSKAGDAEFVTEMFASFITKPEDENLLNVKYRDRSYLVGESEYIIFGRDWMLDNISQSINTIFAIRILFNLLYAFTNTEMREAAQGIAAASSAAIGSGSVLSQYFVLFTWSVAESVKDVSFLCSGESVPVYKDSKTWNLDFGIISKNNSKSDNALSMTYTDYLKLFALIKLNNEETKVGMLKRAAGIMQINLAQENVSFNLSHCFTTVSLTSDVYVGIHTIKKTEKYSY